jgi:uncharacterized protein YegP (UPF0339 family)
MKVITYRKRFLSRVKLVAANGETLMVSETYYSRSNAVRCSAAQGGAVECLKQYW